MANPALLAGDWGTTNLRVWRLDAEGAVLEARQYPHLGVSRLAPAEAAQRFASDIRPLMGAGLPAILCGMVGSTLGWAPAPYVETPVSLADLARNLTVADAGGPVQIVPGVRGRGFGLGDVMRGEETQLFGWLSGHHTRSSGARLVCHPGTHAKWMRVEDGQLTAFATAMTGELYSVLGEHSVLKWQGHATLGAAFDDGLEAAGDGGALSARLFSARARVVAGGADEETTASFVSGLLIGAEVAATPELIGASAGEAVTVIGDPVLCELYTRAIERRGGRVEVVDGETAAVAGLFSLWRDSGRMRNTNC